MSEGDGIATRGGVGSRLFGWLGRFAYDVAVQHFPTFALGTFGLVSAGFYGWQVQEGNAPSPKQILGIASKSDSGHSTPTEVVRPEGVTVSSTTGEGLDPVAAEVRLAVQRRTRGLGGELAGTRVVYSLRNREPAGGGAAIDLGWTMKSPGAEWQRCGPVQVTYSNKDVLAGRIANRINNSLSASEQNGRITCD